jgi:hypothetical protein
MKHLSVIVATIITVMVLGACASGKKTAQMDYQYQQLLAQQQAMLLAQQQQMQQSASLRMEEQCITLADDTTSVNLRQYGEGTGFIESAVMDLAIMTAQERMVNLLDARIQSVARKYVQEGRQNVDSTGKSLFEQLTHRTAEGQCKDCRVIKRSIYDLPNGQIRVYVCLEMNKSKSQLSKNIANVLSEGGLSEIKSDMLQFQKEMTERNNKPVSGEL